MLYKCRTRQQAFLLRNYIACPLGFCAGFDIGFPFGTHDTAELEEKKKMENYCYLLSNYGMVIVHHTCFEIAYLKPSSLHENQESY